MKVTSILSMSLATLAAVTSFGKGVLVTAATIFDIEEIARILPHHYPFLLVDKVVEYSLKKKAVGIKSVTLNEPHFTGHFPDRPITPGVLQVEALVQLAGFVALKGAGADSGGIILICWRR